MHKSALGRFAMVTVLLVSPQLFGQHRSYIPAEQGNRNPPTDDLGEGTPSKFEQLERAAIENSLSPETSRDPSLREPPGTVSVDQLRHPLSGKAGRLIENGQKFSKAGDYQKAIGEFRQALNEPAAVPYAHSLLGTEYLKIGDAPAASIELSEAARLLPGVPANHSNLGYAYLLMGKRQAAERELREAIKIDHTSPQPRFLLGLLLLDGGTTEAADYLNFAEKLLLKARLALAVFHVRHGQPEAAAQELRAYLGSKWAEDGARAEKWLTWAAEAERPSILFGLPPEAR
jgi:tetratricopeptide (TPR) repeat protein